MKLATVHDYDPRFDRAVSVADAKARYLSDDCPDYGLAELERDIERCLREHEGNRY